MLKPAFIDLSHHNTIPESFKEAARSGLVGVIHKCTEGSSYIDDKAKARFSLANDAGLMWGLYHFVRPGSMETQVNFFLAAADANSIADQDTLLALDWEDTNVSLNEAVEFMQRLETLSGRSPVLYSGHVLKEALGGKIDPRLSQNQYRLWLAQYAEEPELPPGWDSYWGWQYTDKGTVPGITPPTDLNAYEGTALQLIRDWACYEGDDEPEPEPEPEEIIVRIIAPRNVTVMVKHVGEDEQDG